MIEARGLTKRYGDLIAADSVTFRIERGQVVGFLGVNGAGKTTTMRMLTGFLPPSDGSAVIDGHDMFEDPLAARRAVGYLPEAPPLYPEMDVEGYLTYVARLKDVPRRAQRDAVARAIERCGLEEARRRVIGNLSKGYRQRVGLAQAIVHDPPVLILDEPTVGLDPTQIQEIRGLIAELAGGGAPAAGGDGDGDGDRAGAGGEQGPGKTVILSTHILPEVEAICPRVILIHRGRIVLDGTVEEVTEGGRTSLEQVFARHTARDAAAPGAPAAEADGQEAPA